MKLIDLTLPWKPCTQVRRIPLTLPEGEFAALVYEFSYDSMTGTYVDFPGHIAETDDGVDAENFSPAGLYRVPASVIRLNRQDGSGAVMTEELQSAADGRDLRVPAIIINALGNKRFDEIAERSVYLHADAAEWLISHGIKLLVSDIYESNKEPQSVFLRLFRAGVLTVCLPVNLHMLPENVRLTVMFPRVKNVTQLPCRIVAETE